MKVKKASNSKYVVEIRLSPYEVQKLSHIVQCCYMSGKGSCKQVKRLSLDQFQIEVAEKLSMHWPHYYGLPS